MKIQFGSGPNLLDGWLNLQEGNGDITKGLLIESNSVDYIFTEHCVEHVTPLQGFLFFKECRRILKPGGVLRVIVPDVKNIWENADEDYLNFIGGSMEQWWRASGMEPPSRAACSKEIAFETILRCHGHRAAYTPDLLLTFLSAAGLQATIEEYGKSRHAELCNVDSHWRQMGLERVKMESVVAEAVKP